MFHWQTQFVELLLDLWTQRNEDVLGHDARTRWRAEQHEVTQQLTEISNNRVHLEPQVQ